MSSQLLVNLGERAYSIWFSDDLTSEVRSHWSRLLSEGRKCAVLTDANVASHQSDALARLFGDLPRLVVAPGEESKSLATLGSVLDFMAERRLDRSSVLFAVGGGVIGDLGGFAAAAFLRGVDYVQVPTTLLAMVDSSVGGKTGINLKAGKNLVGAFHQPKAVYIATGCLNTLPQREFAAGMAEVIKYGLLGDEALFAALDREPLSVGSEALPGVIERCCAIKAGVVVADERETAKEGGRALLNLGHTFGHAIEQVTGYGAYLHGEAVAIGLCAAGRLSQKLGYLSPADVERIERVVAAHRLPTRLRESLPYSRLAEAMGRDKKVRAGALRFVVMRRLGDAATQIDVPPECARQAFLEVGAEA